MNYPPRSNHNSNGKMTIDETVTSLKNPRGLAERIYYLLKAGKQT